MQQALRPYGVHARNRFCMRMRSCSEPRLTIRHNLETRGTMHLHRRGGPGGGGGGRYLLVEHAQFPESGARLLPGGCGVGVAGMVCMRCMHLVANGGAQEPPQQCAHRGPAAEIWSGGCTSPPSEGSPPFASSHVDHPSPAAQPLPGHRTEFGSWFCITSVALCQWSTFAGK